jgi:hypothetical protein
VTVKKTSDPRIGFGSNALAPAATYWGTCSHLQSPIGAEVKEVAAADFCDEAKSGGESNSSVWFNIHGVKNPGLISMV